MGLLDDTPDQPSRVLRRPLDPALVEPGPWRVEVVAVTGSTNADVMRQARAGAASGLVLVAEEQTAGRGRLGRSWVAPPHAALMFSVLVRPSVPAARLGWLPLLTGLAVAGAVRSAAAVNCTLKWPNDLLSPGGGKLAGILAEASAGAVVIGTGLNVSTAPSELPPPGPGALPATSLLAEGAATVDREALLSAILAELDARYTDWQRSGGAPGQLLADYTRLCSTIGKRVQVQMPGGQSVRGEAVGVDADGRLLVAPDSGAPQVAIPAGDVIHVR